MVRLSTTEAKGDLSGAVNRVQYQGERILAHRRNVDACALVSLDNIRALEAVEDRIDGMDAEDALKDPRRISIDEVKGILGSL